MAAYEARGRSDEHFTPWLVFDALGERFDLDVAAPAGIETCVPASRSLTKDGLTEPWDGFIWMNPPFGHQRAKRLWLARFFDHGNGIALTPDRTSAPWFGEAEERADARLDTAFKLKFWHPQPEVNGIQMVRGEGPGTGTTLWAAGPRAVEALRRAASRGLGRMQQLVRVPQIGPRIIQPSKADKSWERDLSLARAFMQGTHDDRRAEGGQHADR